jgi:hypothetical protein
MVNKRMHEEHATLNPCAAAEDGSRERKWDKMGGKKQRNGFMRMKSC